MTSEVKRILKDNLVDICVTLDAYKSFNDFDSLGKDIIMRLSLIRVLAGQVAEKL